MASNSTSTASIMSTSTQTAPTTSPTSSSDPTSSSSIANSSPTPTVSTTDSSSSLTSSISTTSSTSIISSTTSSTTTSSSSTTSSPSTTSTTPSSTTQPPSSTTSQPPNTTTLIVTSTAATTPTSSTSTSTSASSSAATAGSSVSKSTTSSGLSGGGLIAVAVVVPIVAVALIVLAALFFWRKRKQHKDAEELRRKEVEEYGYNPNNDPTLPAMGAGAAGDGPFEMREDGSSGYRGWGTTAVASSGRKASTTVSGGQSAGGIGMAYSEGTSPTGPISDTRSDNPLTDGRPLSGEPEVLGAMGPAASGNRGGDINRGPSNASSSYSAANRSDGSGEPISAGGYGGGQYYNNQYDTGNPYSGPETQYGSPPGRAEMSGQPVIRDVVARRNTRIENPSHFPQQSAGISQNF